MRHYLSKAQMQDVCIQSIHCTFELSTIQFMLAELAGIKEGEDQDCAELTDRFMIKQELASD